MNKEIFNNYEKQINNYERLSLEEANVLLSSIDEKSEEDKNNTKKKVFNGTIYLVLRFIKSNHYEIIESSSYDLNDIINIALKIWYEKVEKQELPRTISKEFALEIQNEILSNNSELKYQAKLFNDDYIKAFIKTYIEYRNKNLKINDTYDILEEMYNANPSLFENNKYGINERNLNFILFNTLEKCYKVLSKNDTREVELDAKAIDRIGKLIEESGLFETLRSCERETSYEDETIDKIENEEFYNFIFNNIKFDERTKDILKRRYGFDDYDCQTQKEIGEKYNRSSTYIGRIEDNSIRKIRKSISKYYR